MTLDFYHSEEAKLTKAIKETNPTAEEYEQLLRNLNSLTVVAVNSIDAQERLACYEEDNSEAPVIKFAPLPVAAEPEPEEEPDTPATTFDEVKARFTEAAQRGVSVKPIINGLGYERLSAIPPEDYDAALAALSEAEANS